MVWDFELTFLYWALTFPPKFILLKDDNKMWMLQSEVENSDLLYIYW